MTCHYVLTMDFRGVYMVYEAWEMIVGKGKFSLSVPMFLFCGTHQDFAASPLYCQNSEVRYLYAGQRLFSDVSVILNVDKIV